MNAENITIEWDEDGCYLSFDGYDRDADGKWTEWESHSFRVPDPEQLYDKVKAVIGPWLRERDEARMEVVRGVPEIHIPPDSDNDFGLFRSVFACDPDESGGYDLNDPKHPRYHPVHADLWDMRERNPDEYEYLRTEAKREAAGE